MCNLKLQKLYDLCQAMSQLWKMHKGHSKAKEDKYNDKYME